MPGQATLVILIMKQDRYKDPSAERMRIMYQYRSAILRGKIKLPPDAMKPLVGPDCAYHLYKYSAGKKDR